MSLDALVSVVVTAGIEMPGARLESGALAEELGLKGMVRSAVAAGRASSKWLAWLR